MYKKAIKPSSPNRTEGPSKPRLWKVLGPGLITGASDDDPSGIATYSQAGSKFGFTLAWTLLFTYPLMVAIQAIAARIGRTTGKGVAGNLREHYPNWLLQSLVAMLFVANTLNIGADLGAMAESVRLLTHVAPAWVYIVGFGALSAAAQIFLNHTRYVAVLKWLTLALCSYFATLCVVKVPWTELAAGLFVPRFSLDRDFWLMVTAILGTTISPYLFFWQASQEAENTKAKPRREPLLNAPHQASGAFARIRLDTVIGMGFSNLVALAILTTAASTLHKAGAKEITSAAQAAEALRPVAGNFAFALFALGIIGTGLLSVPVLAGSAAYALGEARRWPVGLARKPLEAKAFYAALILAMLLGALANAFSINPVTALIWVAVLNGIVAVPVMILMMLMSADQRVMGKFKVTGAWRYVGWLSTAVMTFATIAFFISSL